MSVISIKGNYVKVRTIFKNVIKSKMLTNVTMNVAEIFLETDANRRESHDAQKRPQPLNELTGLRSHDNFTL